MGPVVVAAAVTGAAQLTLAPGMKPGPFLRARHPAQARGPDF